MFIAIRDLAFARGRFTLMALVITLVAFLVTLLSGLSAGLIENNISALMKLPATHIAFEYSDHPTYRNTMVERDMWEGWAEQPGVIDMEPLGHTVFNARTQRDEPLEIALWGLEPGSFIEPPLVDGRPLGSTGNGVIVSDVLVNKGVRIGDVITLDRVLTELEVIGVTEERNIGHMPVIYAPLPKWQEATYGPPGGAAPGERLPSVLFDFVSVIALQLEEGFDPVPVDEEFGTVTLGRQAFYEASTGYKEEVLSINMIQWFLIAISAVVIGAFFTIWTIQRTKEIGLVKALGASNGYLLKDAVGQATLLLLIATVIGVAAGTGVGYYIDQTEIPFMLEGGTISTSALLLIGAGMLGGVLSIRRITSVDPIIALGREQ